MSSSPHKMPAWRVLHPFYLLILAAGGGAAILELAQTLRFLGHETLDHALQRTIPAAAVLVLTFVYGGILWGRGFSRRAPVAYFASYAVTGITLLWLTDGLIGVDDFATPAQAHRAYWILTTIFAALTFIVIAVTINCYRSSARSTA